MIGADRLKRQMTDVVRRAAAGGRPVVPEAGNLLWSMFIDLSSGRSSNGFGPNPISWAEIEAWMRVKRWPLAPHHVEILRAMDDAWLEDAYKRQAAGASAPAGMKTAPMVAGEFSLAAFDVMFS